MLRGWCALHPKGLAGASYTWRRGNYYPIYHFALLIPSRADLGALLEKVLSVWGKVEGYADHLVSEAIYLRDPDNIGVEIYSDRDMEKWSRDPRGYVAMDTLPLDIEDLMFFRRRFGGKKYVPSNTAFGHIHLRGSSRIRLAGSTQRCLA